jgi:hypoxanthine phosphoribosyltransferase
MNAPQDSNTLFSEAAIAARVEAVARDILGTKPWPEIAAPVLMGAFVFAADLLRALCRQGLDLEAEFLWLRSYGRSETPGDVMVLKGPSEIVRGRRILLIDGVLDSGATLLRARTLLEDAGAAGIVTAVAVRKSHPEQLARADHAMFEAGAEFLFGYGMDRGGLGRGIPDIRVKPR